MTPGLTCGLFAQETNQPPEASKLEVGTEEEDSLTAESQDRPSQDRPVVKKRNNISQPFIQIPSGEVILINEKSKLDKILNLLNNNSQNQIPLYSFTMIKMEGNIVDDLAELKISISLTINESDSPVKIPFYLNESFLIDTPSYEGEGKLLQAGAFDKENDGYSWWLQGKGKHLLNFSIRMKLIRQLNNNRLQLSIPPAAISKLMLNIPDNSIHVDNIKNGHLETNVKESKTVLNASLNGTTLDLSWHSIPKNLQEKSSIQTKTNINLHITEDSYLIDALQSIEIRNGTLSEIGIQLPDHFELVDIDSPLIQSHHVDSNRRVTVKFSKPITEKVDIHWNLEADRSENSPDEKRESAISLNGFNINHATKQTGSIGIYAARGFHVSRKKPSLNVHRIDPSTINFSQDVLTAYSFERQPFSLNLLTIERQPHYSVEPFFYLKFTEKEIELSGFFRIEVPSNQSALKTLQFHWPDFKKGGWILEPVQNPGVIEAVHPSTILPELLENGSFTVNILENESTHSQIIEIPIRAQIKLSKDQKNIVIGLPTAEGTIQRDPIIIIEEDPNIIAKFSQNGNKQLKTLGITAIRDNMPIQFRKLNQAKYYRVNPDELTYKVTLSRQPLEINSKASIIAVQKDDRISVSQVINFIIANEKVDHIGLLVSNKYNKQNTIEILLDGKTVKPVFSNSSEGNSQNISLKLPGKTSGNFNIQINHEIQNKDIIKNSHLEIPIFHPQDSLLSEITFEFQGKKYLNPVISDNRWKKENKHIWITKQSPESIPLTLSNSPASFDYWIQKILIRNTIQNGQCFSKAEYRLSGTADDLTISIPNNLTVNSISWNQSPLVEDSNYFSDKTKYGNLRITPPQSSVNNKTSNLLTINYSQKIDQNESFTSSLKLLTPLFPNRISVSQTIQEITLPLKQHLLTHPKGYGPLFSWTRNWFFWDRTQIKAFHDLNGWISSSSNSELVPGNTYAFHCNGAPQPLEFQSMSSSIIVFFGAGFALLSSFILIKIPATRSMFSLFIFGLILATLRIWFENSITLFIQPAILGLALAFLATTIEKKFKKEPVKNIVTLSSPSDLYLPALPQSSLEHHQSIGAGSEDPTSVKHFTSNPLSKSDSGNQL